MAGLGGYPGIPFKVRGLLLLDVSLGSDLAI